jgi:hypothetical protein
LTKGVIKEIDDVSNNFTPIKLCPYISLAFFAPYGTDYFKLSKQRSNYEHGSSTTFPDFNIMSTIISIGNSEECILLTSDATKNSFRRIVQKITNKVILTQVPHHGSIKNLETLFWQKLSKVEQCPAMFSVGNVKKDKLPNIEVVEFFEKENFCNHSSNFVYGISEYYSLMRSSPISNKTLLTSLSLSTFSKLKTSILPSEAVPPKFFGDQTFHFF